MLGALGLCLPFGLAGCSPGSSSAAPAAHALRLPFYGRPGRLDPGIFDPARASASTPLYLASLLNAGLMKLGPDMHVIPELAVSIPTISTDARSYTFTIRQDARFADGEPCTAADVAYSLARALGPRERSPLAVAYLGDIEGAGAVERGQATKLTGVRILQRLTVQIRLTHPDSTFLEKLAFPVAWIVSRHGAGGLGPFVPRGTSRDGTLTLKPRPHYFAGPLQIQMVQVVPVPSVSRGFELYRRGEIDLAWVPPDRLDRYIHNADLQQSASLDAYFAFPPPKEGPALAAHLDRAALVQSDPALSALQSIVPPAVPDYVSSPPSSGDAPASTPPVTVKAAQPGDSLSDALRRGLQRQWKGSSSSRSSVWVVHAVYMLPDPERWLSLAAPIAPHWYPMEVSQAQALTNDPVSRMSTYSQAENWVLQRGLIIPLASGNLGYLVKPAVQSLEMTPAGPMPRNNNWSLVGVS